MSVRKWTDEQLFEAVKTSISKSEALRKLSLKVRPGNFRTLDKYVKLYQLDISHFKGCAHGTSDVKKYTLDEILTVNSFASTGNVKKRLLGAKLIENKCAICFLTDWQGKKLVMVLDHINGIHDDHRIENLRMLCPNCNSQQDTFCVGANRLKDLTVQKKAKKQSDEVLHRKNERKLFREQKRKEILESGIDLNERGSITRLAKKLNSSHTSIKRWVNGR